ncbi:transcriptional regulation of mitochondrial recombination-domain-containing protein [Hypoxylon sp. FL0890]|nr:transcriptional regulation of mitochondrial recombination-domain-containing protein [Hypoxylon sp. FL0890]
MALRVNSITAQLARLSLGISRTSVRFSHTDKAEEKRRKELERSQFPPHHGEKIWIFNHFLDGMTVYSHSPVVKANKSLRQIPFNGKKLKPRKLRKDYWRPLAMIQFPEGYGEVGRSVFQRLRECKTLHELAWGDDMFYDKDGKPLSKHERGKKLNDQKANTIADMAAILGGRGKGNKIWMPVTENPEELANLEAADEKNVKRDEKGARALVKAEVWWVDDQDRNFATEWPSNVTHHRFDEAAVQELGVEDDADGESQSVPTELVAEEQLQKDLEADQKEADQKEADQKEADQKPSP